MPFTTAAQPAATHTRTLVPGWNPSPTAAAKSDEAKESPAPVVEPFESPARPEKKKNVLKRKSIN